MRFDLLLVLVVSHEDEEYCVCALKIEIKGGWR